MTRVLKIHVLNKFNMLHTSSANPRFGETYGFHLQKKLTLQKSSNLRHQL